MANVLQPFQSVAEIRVANTKVGDADTLNFASGASVAMVGNRADITVLGGGGGGSQGAQGWQGISSIGSQGIQGVQGDSGGAGVNHNILSTTHPDYFDTMSSISSMRGLWLSYNNASSLYIMVGTRTVSDAMQIPMYFGTNELISITTTGVNGLDTGTEASGWYYIWAIGTGSSAPKGLLSTSAFSPTMPPGYTYKRLIGSVYNDLSGNFVPFVQYGDTVYATAKLWFHDSYLVANTWVSKNSAYISPLAKELYFNGFFFDSLTPAADGANMYAWPFALPSPTDNGVRVFKYENLGTTYDMVSACQWIPVANQTVFFKATFGSATAAIEGTINGYKYRAL